MHVSNFAIKAGAYLQYTFGDRFVFFRTNRLYNKISQCEGKNLQLANFVKVPIALRHSLATILLNI